MGAAGVEELEITEGVNNQMNTDLLVHAIRKSLMVIS
jgi:hypothetical protein